MPDCAETIDRYCRAWQDRTPSERRAILEPIWRQDAVYLDPTVDLRGLDELIAHIERVQARYPGSTTIRTSALDRHHLVARFHWAKVLADGSRLPEGIDFAEFAEDGTIRRIVGFFGPLRAAEN